MGLVAGVGPRWWGAVLLLLLCGSARGRFFFFFCVGLRVGRGSGGRRGSMVVVGGGDRRGSMVVGGGRWFLFCVVSWGERGREIRERELDYILNKFF